MHALQRQKTTRHTLRNCQCIFTKFCRQLCTVRLFVLGFYPFESVRSDLRAMCRNTEKEEHDVQAGQPLSQLGSAAMSSSSVASSVPASGGSAVPTGTGSANLGDRSVDPAASEAESSSAGKLQRGVWQLPGLYKELQCAASAVEGKETR